jgi:hypothetical protein
LLSSVVGLEAAARNRAEQPDFELLRPRRRRPCDDGLALFLLADDRLLPAATRRFSPYAHAIDARGRRLESDDAR